MIQETLEEAAENYGCEDCYGKKVNYKVEPKCTCKNPTDNTCNYCDAQESKIILENAKKIVKKQKTLEEASNNYSSNELSKLGFINGAKWQQERSYSEEEVLDLLFDFQIHRNDLENCVEAREWFEQFKKK